MKNSKLLILLAAATRSASVSALAERGSALAKAGRYIVEDEDFLDRRCLWGHRE